MYVAVVVARRKSERPFGDWASFVETEKDAAIGAALEARESWQKSGKGPYKILVGELTEQIVVPVAYQLQPIGKQLPKSNADGETVCPHGHSVTDCLVCLADEDPRN